MPCPVCNFDADMIAKTHVMEKVELRMRIAELEAKIPTDKEVKVVTQMMLNQHARGVEAGRVEGLHEAARVVLACARQSHRHVADYMSEKILEHIKVKYPNVHSTPPDGNQGG